VADDGRIAYDALHDSELTHLLLQAIADGGRAGTLCFAHEPGAEIDTGLDSLGADRRAEQHQPDVRRGQHPQGVPPASPGPTRPGGAPALAMRGSTHVAEPLAGSSPGWTGRRSSRSCPYLRAASDGWSLAATSVRDL